jgi:hypothetical protein
MTAPWRNGLLHTREVTGSDPSRADQEVPANTHFDLRRNLPDAHLPGSPETRGLRLEPSRVATEARSPVTRQEVGGSNAAPARCYVDPRLCSGHS